MEKVDINSTGQFNAIINALGARSASLCILENKFQSLRPESEYFVEYVNDYRIQIVILIFSQLGERHFIKYTRMHKIREKMNDKKENS